MGSLYLYYFGCSHYETSPISCVECRRLLTIDLSQTTWVMSLGRCCYHPQPPSPFVIITRLKADIYEGGRLSWSRQCSNGVFSVTSLHMAMSDLINTNCPPGDFIARYCWWCEWWCVRVTKAVGMDCEMVGVGDDGKESILARVSIVNQFGCCVYDKFVRPTERVTDYRTKVSGVRRTDLVNGIFTLLIYFYLNLSFFCAFATQHFRQRHYIFGPCSFIHSFVWPDSISWIPRTSLIKLTRNIH